RLPERLWGVRLRVRGARQDEEQVGEPVQVDERERAQAVGDRKRGNLRAPADRAGDVQARRRFRPARQDEALQRLELRVERVAEALELVDLALRDPEAVAVAVGERNRDVRAEVEELVLDPRER